MTSFVRKLVLSLALGGAAIALPTIQSAADDKPGDAKKATPKDEKKGDPKKGDEKKGEGKDDEKKLGPPAKLPEFSKDFAYEGEVSGVVSHADEDSVTLRFTYRVSTGGKNTKQETKDVTFKFVDGGLARTKVAPTKLDAKGKFVKLPQAELDPIKKPQGAPGWHIERGDIKPGAIVTLELLRPKSIPASKVSLDDKVIKFAIVTGETTPPKMSREDAEKFKGKNKEKKEKK